MNETGKEPAEPPAPATAKTTPKNNESENKYKEKPRGNSKRGNEDERIRAKRLQGINYIVKCRPQTYYRKTGPRCHI